MDPSHDPTLDPDAPRAPLDPDASRGASATLDPDAPRGASATLDPDASRAASATLERARAGDREALEALLAEVAPLVHRFGSRMCRHEADAEDVVQDTLLSIASHLPEFEGRSSLSSWVFALARTACARKRRGLKNQPHLPEEAAPDHGAEGPTPEAEALRRELAARLEAALASLRDEHREVLLLRDVEGLTAPEVADALGVGVDAVKSRLHRARAALREAYARTAEAPLPKTEPACPDVAVAISRRLEGDLDDCGCDALEAHLASCPGCSADCDALRTALGECRALAAGPVPDAVRDRIRAAVASLEETRPAANPSGAEPAPTRRDP